MDSFIDVDYSQNYKERQLVGGDIFLSKKIKEENRTISVLSDGLGSGIKASVLATLTATMAAKFISSYKNIRRTAEIIMRTLPVCKVRKINYSTFTIIDIKNNRETDIIEYDNPSVLVVRDEQLLFLEKTRIEINNNGQRKNVVYHSKFKAEQGDRLIMLSDGVTQSGMGTKSFPLGWGLENTQDFILGMVKTNPEISARELSHSIVAQAHKNDLHQSKDDTTCGVVHFRKPRELLIISGPPTNPAKDKEIGEIINQFDGKKIICGGTTANIISRELDKKITVNLQKSAPSLPPTSRMPGIDLVTEGILTLGKVAEMLEASTSDNLIQQEKNAATELIEHLLNSDIIHFLVGTKINEAHQDPNIPVELEIRRNVVKKIIGLLDKKFLKETNLRFI